MNQLNPNYSRPADAGAGGPIFNVPAVVLALIALFVAVQLAFMWLPPADADWLLLSLAFTPARYSPAPEFATATFPGGAAAYMWTFVTHMFVHGGWLHLVINSLWLLAFGSVVAGRFGTMRFLLLSFAAAAGGAAANLALHWGSFILLIGASGAVSGLMAGAIRLMFARSARFAMGERPDFGRLKALSLKETFSNPRSLTFLLVWLVINFVFGVTGIGAEGSMSLVAWEAHLGGFVVGLLLFGVLDPVKLASADY